MARQWELVDEEEVVEAPDKKWASAIVVDSPESPSQEADGDGATWQQGLEHSVVKGYGKLATGIANMPAMLTAGLTWPTRKALNYAGVDEKITDYMYLPTLSEAEYFQPVNEYLNSYAEGIEKGGPWDMAQTAVEWGGAGPLSAARGFTKAIPDLAMAGGAVIGEKFGGELGEIAGGLAGALALLRGKSKNKALDLIEEGKGDEVLDMAKKAMDEGERGTLADLSRDQGVADVESLVSGRENRGKYATEEIERQVQIAEEVRNPFGGGDAESAAAAGQAHINQIYEEIIPRAVREQQEIATIPLRAGQRAAAEAHEIPQQAAVEAGLEQSVAKARAATAMSNTVEAARRADEAKAALATEKTLDPYWSAFDALPAVDVTQYKKTVEEFIDALPVSQNKKFTDDSISALRDEDISEMSPKEIQDILLDMRAVIDRAYKGGKVSTSIKNMEKLWKQIDAQLVGEIPSYKAAKEGESALRQRFDQGIVGDSRTLEPELFSRSIGQGDEAGAVASRYLAAADIPGMPEAQGEFLKSLAQRSTKGIDEVFMKEYESMMSTLTPELQQQARALIDANKSLDAAGAAQDAAISTANAAETQTNAAEAAVKASEISTAKETARLERAVEKAQVEAAKTGEGLRKTTEKGITNRYIKNPTTTILDSLKNPDDVSDLVALKNAMGELGETDSLLAKIGDVITKKLSSGGAQAGLYRTRDRPPPLSARAIEDFNVMAESLQKAGFDQNAIKQVWQSLYKLGTKQQKANARQVIFGSDKTARQFLDSAAGAVALRVLPGSSLIMGGAIRKVFAKLSGSGDRKVLAAIDDFMLNPDKYIMAAENARNPAEAANTIAQEIVAASQAMAFD